MTLNEFTDVLSKSLIERGVPEKKVKNYVSELLLTFTTADMATIDAYECVEDMADVIDRTEKFLTIDNTVSGMTDEIDSENGSDSSAKTKKEKSGGGHSVKSRAFDIDEIFSDFSEENVHENTPTKKSTQSPEEQSEKTGNDDINQYAPSEEMMSTFGSGGIPMGYAHHKFQRDNEKFKAEKVDWNSILPKINETPEGKRKFILTTVLLSPLFLIGTILYYILMAIPFAIEIAIIIAAVIILIAVAAVGTLASVGGIIYGVVSLASVKCVGIYEIGFGIIIGGAVLCSSVLIYNFALRFMPFVFKKTGYLARMIFWKTRIALRNYRGGFSK